MKDLGKGLPNLVSFEDHERHMRRELGAVPDAQLAVHVGLLNNREARHQVMTFEHQTVHAAGNVQLTADATTRVALGNGARVGDDAMGEALRLQAMH